MKKLLSGVAFAIIAAPLLALLCVNSFLLIEHDPIVYAAAIVYVSQNGGTFSGGAACNGQPTISVSTLGSTTYNTPGTAIYLCGNLGSTRMVYNGSGVSGTPNQIIWDTGTVISFPTSVLGTGIGFNISGSYNVFNGGVACGWTTSCNTLERANPTSWVSGMTGIVQSPNSGTAFGNGVNGAHFQLISQNGTNNTFKNLICRNGYVHTSASDIFGGPYTFICLTDNNTTAQGLTVTDSTFHDEDTPIYINSSGAANSNMTFQRNDFYAMNWALGTGMCCTFTTSNLIFSDNHLQNMAAWDDTNDAHHHDGIILYGDSPNDNGFSQNVYIYNNFFDGNPGYNSTAWIYYSGGQPSPGTCFVFNNVVLDSTYNPSDALLTMNITGGQTSNSGCNYLNNTIVGANLTTGTQGIITESGNINFVNNVATNAPQLNYLQNTHLGAAPVIQTLDYNTYGTALATKVFTHDGSPQYFTTLGAWQSFTGQESHSTYTQAGLNLNSLGQPNSGETHVINAGTNLTSQCSGVLVALCKDTSMGNSRTPQSRPATGSWNTGAFQTNGTGGGGSPAVSFTTSPLAFGSVNVGSNSTLSEQVNNSGSATLTLSSPYYTISGPNAADFTNTGAGSCANNGTVNTSSSCTISIKFAPSIGGAETATLTVNGNAGGSVALTGSGVAPSLMVNPGPSSGTYYNWCAATTASTLTSFSCTWNSANILNGTAICSLASNNPSMTVSSVTDSNSNSYTQLLSTSLGGFGSQVLFLVSNLAAGANTTTFHFSSSPSLEIKCAEYYGPLPTDVTPVGTTGNSTALSAGITTVNATDLLVAMDVATNDPTPGSSWVNRPNSGQTVTGDLLQDMSVTSAGAYTAQMGQSPGGQWILQVAALQVPTAGLNFGNQAVGVQGSAFTVTATNTGTSSLSTPAFSITGTNASDFAETATTCGASLAAGASCTYSLKFTPGGAGNRTATFTVSGTGASAATTLYGFGVGATQVAPVVFNPPVSPTPFSTPPSVSMSTATSGAAIIFTSNGSQPTESGCSPTNGTLYTGAVTPAAGVTTTYIAIGCKSGDTDSNPVNATYIVNPTQLGTPTCTPGTGTYPSAQTINCTAPLGGTICYTLDTTIPATNSGGTCGVNSHTIQYTGPFTISGGGQTTIKAIATESGFTDSGLFSSVITINAQQSATPTLSKPSGPYQGAQNLTASSATPGAVLCYTINSISPQGNGNGACTTGTTLANGGTISISGSAVVQILASTPGYTDSGVVAYYYTINFASYPAVTFAELFEEDYLLWDPWGSTRVSPWRRESSSR